jgi:hypothetical protein
MDCGPDSRFGWSCGSNSAAFQPLERRTLLAGFAGVGFERVGTSLAAVIVEGESTTSGLATGTIFRSGTTGRDAGTALSREWIEQRDMGGLFLRPSLGTTGADAEIGANFLGSRGFDAGWYAGTSESTDDASMWYMVERPEGEITTTDIQGNWIWTVFQWNASTGAASVLNGSMIASGNFLLWFATGFGAAPIARTTEVTDAGDGGQFQTSRDEFLYLNEDKSVLLTVDVASEDGDLSFGFAVRADTDATVEDVAGGYRWGVAAASEAAKDLFGTGVSGVGARFLDLREDGTATVYGLADYDAGDLTGGVAASWALIGSTINLTINGSPARVEFTVSPNGSTLMPYSMVSGAGIDSRVSGLATRFTPVGTVTNSILASDGILETGTGKPLVYILGTDGVWRVTDLIADASGGVTQVAPGLDIAIWTDLKDSKLYAAVPTVDGLYLYQRSLSGTWTVRNLTSEVDSSQAIIGGLTQFISVDASKQVTIAGLAADGDLIMYRQSGSVTNGNYAYGFNDVADEFLRPIGREMPVFVGPLISYVTPWNGQNIAGLNASGQIEVIWNSPKTEGYWVYSNLSTITGAPPFSGGLTVYQTRWKGINIVGVDGTGKVITTWWVPKFAGFWATSDLTDVATGPLLDGASIVAFHTPDGGLNIAGIKDDGEIALYWWVPNSDNTWKIRELTEGDEESIARPEGELRAQVLEDGSVNIFGRDAMTELVRIFWEPTLEVDDWRIQNVSDIALS